MWHQGWASHGCLSVLGGRSSRAAPDSCPAGSRAGWSCRILSQLLLWLSLSCCWLRMPQVPWCGTAGTPTHSLSRVLPQARLCAHSSALFSFSIHLREALFCPSLLHVPRQIFFLRAHQCLETQRDTQEAPSTPGTTPSFPGTQTPFPIP